MYLDILKAVSIIFVVIGHCIQYGSGMQYLTYGTCLYNPVFIFIYSFHMPLFMLISGFLFSYSLKNKTTKGILFSKIKQLIIPLICWSFIATIIQTVKALAGVSSSQVSFIWICQTLLSSFWGGPWFLWALWWCSLCVILGKKLFKDNAIYYVILLIIAFVTPDKNNIALYKFMFPFFLLGYIFNHYDLKTKLKKIYTIMKPEYKTFVEDLIELAIREDIGDGDHTSLASVPESTCGRMRLLVKQPGILAGVEIAEMVFRRLDADVKFEKVLDDGAKVEVGDVAFYVEGKERTMLQAERIVLNIMQRMTGVATQTAKYVERLEGTGCRVLDTRKTTPGMRVLDKMAVKIGGGENHRIGLFDMILLKDNHIDFCGGVAKAIRQTHEYLAAKGKKLPIEVEVRTMADIDEALGVGGIDRIMLDNFSVEQTREAVAKIAGRVEVESSGGITFDTIRDYAECGVDFISVGALTHQIKSVDLSLKACE